MPSMANASFAALVCALLAAHLVAANMFKTADRDMSLLAANKQAIDPAEPVNALLVGGSGMHYGLSARILSGSTPYNFLNLALILEGNSWENYRNFLAGLDMIDHDEIALVIYSSHDFYGFEDQHGEFTLTGARRGLMLFNRESWLQRPFGRGPVFGPRNADRTVIDPETGDMVFLDGVCDAYYPAVDMIYPADDVDRIAARVVDLSDLFPNARVLVRPWPISEHRGQPLGEVHRNLSAGLADENVEVMLPQMPFYTPDWACDAAFHPTAEGRDALSRIAADTIIADFVPAN